MTKTTCTVLARFVSQFLSYDFSSVKKVGKDDEEEKRPKRMLSPTLPDGDLPSYMKATESYFKKVYLIGVYCTLLCF